MAKITKENAGSRFDAAGENLFPSAVNENKLSYMIFQIAKSHRGLAGELLRPLGLYPGQEILLMQLWDRDGQTQSELISQMGLDASTVTKMVQRLETQGLISRSQSEQDRRAIIVKLTASGKRLKPKVEEMWAALNETTVRNLTKTDEALLLSLFQKVFLGLRKSDET